MISCSNQPSVCNHIMQSITTSNLSISAIILCNQLRPAIYQFLQSYYAINYDQQSINFCNHIMQSVTISNLSISAIILCNQLRSATITMRNQSLSTISYFQLFFSLRKKLLFRTILIPNSADVSNFNGSAFCLARVKIFTAMKRNSRPCRR